MTMIFDVGACPPSAVLENIAAGQPVDDDALRHTEQCRLCREALERIRNDNRFLADFRIGRDWPQIRDEPSAWDIRLPGYDVVRELHRGGQGVVLLATQRSTKRPVAIKVMRQGVFATAADRARFMREIETLGRLDHPNIVAVHDAGVADGLHYFVMDYIDGPQLDEAASLLDPPAEESAVRGSRSVKPVTPPRRERLVYVLETFAKVCDAVHAAHLRGVIHRDLKPSNIRIDAAGEPRVLDFGLAKSIDEGESAMTRTGQFVGSPPWASPEQVEGATSRIDLRTDVYSLGAILFQLLTGLVPFEVRENIRDTFDAILQDDPPRPSRLAAARGLRLDDELDTIVLKCLAKDRERRYQSPGELARDLRRHLAGEAIDARRESAWYILRKTAWRRRRLLLGAAAPILLLTVLAYTLMRSADAARLAAQERSLREAESHRNATMLEITRRIHARPGSPADSPGGLLSTVNFSALQTDLDTGALSVVDHGVAMLLAETLGSRGRLAEADELVRRAIYMLQRDKGSNHPEIGRMRTVLAELLLRRGNRMPEAEQVASQAVDELARAYGRSSVEAARAWNMLARVRLARRDFDGAQAAADHARATGDDVLSAEALAVLAAVYASADRSAEARQACLNALEALLLRVQDADARLLDAVEVASGLVESGVIAPADLISDDWVRGGLRDLSPADRLQESAAVLRGGADGTPRDAHILPARFVMIGLRERLLGPDHPSLGASLASAASTEMDAILMSFELNAAGLEECIDLFQRALPLQIAAHGPDSPLVGKSYERIGKCLSELCRLREATDWFAGDLALWKRQPPEARDEYQVMIRARWTAWYATRAGRFADGLIYCDESLELIERLFGPEHVGAAMIHACRALCLVEAGDDEEARRAIERTRALMAGNRVPWDQHVESLRFLGQAYLRLGRLDEAREALERSWSDMADTVANSRPFLEIELSWGMYRYCLAVGDHDRARRFADRLLAVGMGDFVLRPAESRITPE